MDEAIANVDQYASGWTPEREAELCRLWPTSLTAEEIAAQIGGFEGMRQGGKMSIISKARRLHLVSKKAVACNDAEALRRRAEWHRRQVRENKRAKRSADRQRQRAARRKTEPATASPEVVTLFPSNDVSLQMLRPTDCRFITSSFGEAARFCGRRIEEGHSWCAPHCRIVYQSPDERKAGPRSPRGGGRVSPRFGYLEAAE